MENERLDCTVSEGRTPPPAIPWPSPCSVLCLALERHLGFSCRSSRLPPPLKINPQANLGVRGRRIAHEHHLSPRTDDEPASRGEDGLGPHPVGNFFPPEFSRKWESLLKAVITLKIASGAIGISPGAAESQGKEALFTSGLCILCRDEWRERNLRPPTPRTPASPSLRTQKPGAGVGARGSLVSRGSLPLFRWLRGCDKPVTSCWVKN